MNFGISRIRSLVGIQEIGLILVVVLLGTVLTAFGGKVRMIEFHKNAAGENERVVVEKNKFLNARNLTQLAKDTSFVAIMAVGATFVIIAGGIDLSVGATYALASVLSALVFSKGENQVWRGVLVRVAVDVEVEVDVAVAVGTSCASLTLRG